MGKLIIARGKHSDTYYNADTDEQVANAALDIIRDWLEWQFIRPGQDPFDPDYVNASWNVAWRETIEWSKKDLAEESEATEFFNKKVREAKKTVARKVDAFEQENADYVEAKRMVDEWDISVVTPEPRMGQTRMLHPKPYVRAYRFVRDRSGGEYQQVDEEFTQEFEDDAEASD